MPDTPSRPPDQSEPSPEDPNRFPDEPSVAALDEAPDGRTPADTADADEGSLPPGAPRRGD